MKLVKVEYQFDCSKAVFSLRRTQHGEEHRHETVAIRPAQGEHSESPVISLGVVVMDPGQKLHALAAVAEIQGVVGNQYLGGGIVRRR